MRAWFRLVAAGAVFAMVLCGKAWADPVTIRVSEVASGTFGGRDFTDKLVTLEAHFTTEEYQSCATAFERGEFCDSSYYLAGDGETATVEGLGRLAAGGGYAGVYAYADPDLKVGFLQVGDFSNILGITVRLDGFDGNILDSFGPKTGQTSGQTSYTLCNDLPSRCPAFYGLDDPPGANAGLYFDSVGETGTAEIIVGSPVPEPGTWMMVGTGLVGGLATVRRRLS